MRACLFFAAILAVLSPAIADDAPWFLRSFENSEFGDCGVSKHSPAQTFESFKVLKMQPSILEADDKSIQVRYIDQQKTWLVIYYRSRVDCETAVAASTTASRAAAEADRRRLDPYR